VKEQEERDKLDLDGVDLLKTLEPLKEALYIAEILETATIKEEDWKVRASEVIFLS
jgi:hypothetical protein